jgi:hypothetical protein
MLFSSKVHRPERRYEDSVFCVEVDEELDAFLKKQMEWVRTNPDAVECKVKMSSERARFCDSMDDYDEIVEEHHRTGDCPLDYYGVVMDHGVPNRDYWECKWNTPHETWAVVGPHSICFECRVSVQYYHIDGLGEKDFFRR